ncbi:MAG: energy transducer TonB [Planctomycetales bacterium]|nr:energy transducer TonB [Planctomycetales bacterium]
MRRTLTRPSARKSALVSLGTHVVLFVAMAIWPKSFVDRISFAGRQEAIQLVGVFTTAVTPPYDASILPEFHAPEESAAHERDVTRRNNDVEKLSLPDQAEPSRQPAPDPLDLQSPNHVSADVTSVSVANSTARRAPAKQLQSVEPLEFQFSRRTFHPPTPSSVASVAGVAQVAGVEEDRSSDFASNAPPIYPAEAVRKRWEGTVLLRLHVTATGEVSRLEVIESSGHAVLDDAAVEAVRHWRGKPSRRRGQPVATVEILPIRFRL